MTSKHWTKIRFSHPLSRFALLTLLAMFIGDLYLENNRAPLVPNPQGSYWITHPSESIHDFGVFHFRKIVDLHVIPPQFVIHVSGDRRYELFVNGMRALNGPASGDLNRWRYETKDIAYLLRPGRNVLAAVIWNFGPHALQSHLSNETAFLVQGNSTAEAVVNSNGSWKVWANKAVEPLPINPKKVRGYFAAGSGERRKGSQYPWGWELPGFDDRAWRPAALLVPGGPLGLQDPSSRWKLVSRTIPPMEEQAERLLKVARSKGVPVPAGFLSGQDPLCIPAHCRMTLLLDQTYLTTAYPELVTSGGKGATLTMTYAEALWTNGTKGNRDEIEGGEILGLQDVFLPDGGEHRLFRPLWWRTYRYLQLDVETGADPVVIEDLRGLFTAYPFQRAANFQCDDAELEKIWEIGWRTFRLCAHETFVDCPYYEQLQYVGDARLQALLSYYLSGDSRLAKNAIELLDASRNPEGLTESRYPSSISQTIPSYTLFWVGMVHDLWWSQGESDFVRQFLPGIAKGLAWFESRLTPLRLLGHLPGWNFADWTPGFKDGLVPQEPEGQSSLLSLQFAAALREAAELESSLGNRRQSAHYEGLACQIIQVVGRYCWDPRRDLLADTPARTSFSQHANTLAVLLDLVPPERQQRFMEKILTDPQLIPCSYYFRFYLFEAMKKAGLGDQYLEQLKPWRELLATGLTTWPEKSEPTRSDCHAWSAHPNWGLLATVAGIEPGAAGFQRITIQPHLGNLRELSVAVPHPQGIITARYQKKGNRLKAEITLPQALDGMFLWGDQSIPLQAGRQQFSLP